MMEHHVVVAAYVEAVAERVVLRGAVEKLVQMKIVEMRHFLVQE